MDINNLGIGKIQVGQSIDNIQDLIEFKGSGLKDSFLVFPNEELFFVYSKDINIEGCLNVFVEKLMIGVDDQKKINKIFMFFVDPSNEIEKN